MCYLVRQQAFEAEPGGVASPPRPDGLRQRWVGAAALTLVAGVAIAAAMVVPSSPSPQLQARDAGAAPVTTSKSVDLTGTPASELTALPVDDDVPTRPDVARASAGHCHHGL